MKSWIKITLGVIGTIILGAIGSGLWERFLSKFFDTLVNLSIEFVNFIFRSYKDGIYETASLGFHETHSVLLTLLAISLLPMVYIRLLKKHPVANNENSNLDRTARKLANGNIGYITLKLLTLTVIISSLFIMTKISYTNRVITYSMRSLDIIKPYISESDHEKLISQFYQVRSTDDYEKFNNSVQGIANKNSLRLPENTPL